jgi:lycopene cyclase CruA
VTIARDKARARVRDAGGDELLERLDHLDALGSETKRTLPTPRAPDRGAHLDFDVVVAGGGLWLLVTPLLAARGLRVGVFDRARAAVAHREWNASRGELERLVDVGLVMTPELESMIRARYEKGRCRFYGGGAYDVRGALDHAVDAGALLAHGRRLAEARGVVIHDGHAVLGHASNGDSVAIRTVHRGAESDVTARVLVDARGAASPLASADLVCPTVGGVMTGLAEGGGPNEIDPQIGEILATTEPATEGRQHFWEAFPGRAGEVTVYLFYYAHARERSSLIELFARFFNRYPSYKRGDARLLRPTFGKIPGWSRLSRVAPPARGVVLVGDAAANHSALTCCGFGAALRSFEHVADTIAQTVLDGAAPREASAERDAPIHALTGALAHLIASRRLVGQGANELLDAAFAALADMGNDAYGALLRDEMRPLAFAEFLSRTAARHPKAWPALARGLGPVCTVRWGAAALRAIAAHRRMKKSPYGEPCAGRS